MQLTQPTYLEPLNKEAALKLGEEIDVLLSQISAHELRLAKSYARLGGLLREVKNQMYWMTFGFDRFSSYLEHVRGRIGRERSQVYAILSVAETLLPHISEERLEQIGISKAHELKRLVQQGGNVNAYVNVPLDPNLIPPQPFDSAASDVVYETTVQLMDYAADKDTTAKMLRVKVNEILHIHESPKGNWLDLEGFYVLPDEKKEIDQFWELGRKVLEITSEHEYEVRKEVFLAAVRESVGTWSATQ